MLSIAGSDPSGGAGIQADLKTFALLGVEGCAVPTALTVQNSRGVARIEALPAELVAEQIDAVLGDIDVRAVKIGMLANTEIVRVVAHAMRAYQPPFVVLDPVIRSTGGAALLSDDGLDALRRDLLPVVTLVTPNAVEAGAMTGCPLPCNASEARSVAERIRALGVSAVVVTGGHIGNGVEVVDVLLSDQGFAESRVARVNVARTHGTGCRYTSAVASFVALGASLADACGAAQRYVHDALTRQGPHS